MASGRMAGIYRLYIESPTGERKLVKSADSAYWNVSGLGSADGTISTTATPEKWNYLPLSQHAGASGYKIVMTLEASTADSIDASDCVALIPIQVNNQSETLGIPGGNGLGTNNFTAELSASDSAFVAGVETPVFKARAVEGVKQFRIGGEKVFLSLENDSA